MLVPDFVSRNPEFYKHAPKASGLWELVYNQAKSSTRRPAPGEQVDVIRSVRPNEPDVILQYREKNFRLYAKDGVDKFHTKIIRIFRNSGIKINQELISQRMRDWLENYRFNVSGEELDLWSYFYEYVVLKSFEDPNSVLLPFPRHDGLTPPAAPVDEGGHPPNELVPIEPLHIPSQNITYVSDDVFSWYGGKVLVKANGATRKEKFYYLVDAEWYYLYLPTGWNDGRLNYELIEWYKHDAGNLPINFLPGRNASDGSYRESYLHPYFEYCDEASARASDGQANWVQHCYPKVIMDPLPCPDCEGGYVNHSKPSGGVERVECDSCHGTGRIRDIGQYEVLFRPEPAMGEAPSSNPYQLVTPPDSNLRTTFDIPFELFEMAKKAIGLDVLINLEESGEAKKHRLEDLQDILQSFGNAIFDCMERFLAGVEVLLYPRPEGSTDPGWKFPTVLRPMTYSIKSATMLKDEAQNALPADRLSANIHYYSVKYSNDPKLLRVYKFALYYTPLLTMTEDEIRNRLAAGIYDQNDVIKRDLAVQVFMRLSETAGFDNWSVEEARNAADEYFRVNGLLNTELDVIAEPIG